MKMIIEDTWFPAGTTIRISGGSDELTFLRCSFEGGESSIGSEVDRAMFSRCIFRGTRFSGQALSDRIATGCRSMAPETEETAPPGGTRHARFRS